MQNRSVVVVVNPVSGSSRGPELAARLQDTLAGHGWEVTVARTEGDGDAGRFAREACAAGAGAVVAIGGDGTIQAVAQAVVGEGARIPVGHLPSGTTNAIARAFGLTDDVDALCGHLERGTARPVDLGRLVESDRTFLLMATVGDPARWVTGAPRRLKNRIGFGAYLWAALRATFRPRYAHVSVELDGRTLRRKANGLLVANATSFERPAIDLVPAGAIDDGQLNLAIVNAPTLGHWLVMLGRILLRRQQDGDALELLPVRRVRLEAVPRLPVQIDGEPVGETPVTVEVLPRAVRLIAGGGESAGEGEGGGDRD